MSIASEAYFPTWLNTAAIEMTANNFFRESARLFAFPSASPILAPASSALSPKFSRPSPSPKPSTLSPRLSVDSDRLSILSPASSAALVSSSAPSAALSNPSEKSTVELCSSSSIACPTESPRESMLLAALSIAFPRLLANCSGELLLNARSICCPACCNCVTDVLAAEETRESFELTSSCNVSLTETSLIQYLH